MLIGVSNGARFRSTAPTSGTHHVHQDAERRQLDEAEVVVEQVRQPPTLWI